MVSVKDDGSLPRTASIFDTSETGGDDWDGDRLRKVDCGACDGIAIGWVVGVVIVV